MLRRITPICVANTSVSAILQTRLDYRISVEAADTMFRYSFKILPDRLKLIRLYPCGSLGQSISFVFGARVGHFAATPQSDVVRIWSRDLGVMATLSVRQKMPFFSCIYNPQITVSPTSSFSASFNGKRIKNHPIPWTCPLND